LNLRSLIVAVLILLAGCVTTSRAPAPAPPVIIAQSTWQQVDRDIVAASRSATEQAKIYSRGAMDYWRTRVYQLTEENFIPWFSSYWTQEWLSMKVSWYTISAKGEQDASAKRLAAYLLEEYQERVLNPVAVEIDPDQILGLATAVDQDLRPRLRRFAGAHMGQHAMTVEHPLHQNLQLAAGRLLAKQPRRNHPGIVEHHQIARAQMLKQISELTVCQGTADPIQGQQPTVATLGQRMAGNQRIRELKSKVRNTHDGVRLAGPGSLAEISKILHVPD